MNIKRIQREGLQISYVRQYTRLWNLKYMLFSIFKKRVTK